VMAAMSADQLGLDAQGASKISCRSLCLGRNLPGPQTRNWRHSCGLLIVALAQQGRDHQQAAGCPQGRRRRIGAGEGFEQPQATPVSRLSSALAAGEAVLSHVEPRAGAAAGARAGDHIVRCGIG